MTLDPSSARRAAAIPGALAMLVAMLTAYCQLSAFEDPVPLSVSVEWALAMSAGLASCGVCLWNARDALRTRVTSGRGTDLAVTFMAIFAGSLALCSASSAAGWVIDGQHVRPADLAARAIELTPALAGMSLAIVAIVAAGHWRASMIEASRRATPGSVDAAVSDWLDLPEEPRLRLRPADISLVRTAGNYCALRCGQREFLVRATAKTLEERLRPHGFARVHRTVIVNLRHIQAIRTERAGRVRLMMHDGTELRSSRGYGRALTAQP